jgi:hypothetical protein
MIHPSSTLRSLLLGVVSLVLSASAIAQPPSPLSVELRTPTREVRRGDLFLLQVGLSNVDEARTVVLRGDPGFGPAGGLELRVTDSQGRTTIAPRTVSYVTLSEAQDGVRKTLLRPGQALWINRHVRVRDLFPAPGSYRLEVRYTSPSPSSRSPALPGRVVEGASEQSNIAEIRLVD